MSTTETPETTSDPIDLVGDVPAGDLRPGDRTRGDGPPADDEAVEAVEAFVGHLVGHLTGAAAIFGVWLGDELGLYRALADDGPTGHEQLAAATGCHPRLVREWLDGQCAAGLVERRPETDHYALPDAHAVVLADEDSPAFHARGTNVLGAMYLGFPKVVEAFLGRGEIPWGDHSDHLFAGVEWFFRPGYRAFLASDWIPALDGVAERLLDGGRVADVGCGHGASIVALAEAFPAASFAGVDAHDASIAVARDRVVEAGIEDRVELQVATATGYDGTHDLVCFFDCLHDMGDPVAALRHAREHLAEDGTVMLVEPMALADRDANIAENPFATMSYHASLALCVPNSLSQETGAGLGAQAGEQVLRGVLEEAGFSRVRVAAETPTNLVIEARP